MKVVKITSVCTPAPGLHAVFNGEDDNGKDMEFMEPVVVLASAIVTGYNGLPEQPMVVGFTACSAEDRASGRDALDLTTPCEALDSFIGYVVKP